MENKFHAPNNEVGVEENSMSVKMVKDVICSVASTPLEIRTDQLMI